MFVGYVGVGVFSFDQSRNRNFFDLSRGLISEGYILVEQGIFVVAVLLLKTYINFVIFTIFFI